MIVWKQKLPNLSLSAHKVPEMELLLLIVLACLCPQFVDVTWPKEDFLWDKEIISALRTISDSMVHGASAVISLLKEKWFQRWGKPTTLTVLCVQFASKFLVLKVWIEFSWWTEWSTQLQNVPVHQIFHLDICWAFCFGNWLRFHDIPLESLMCSVDCNRLSGFPVIRAGCVRVRTFCTGVSDGMFHVCPEDSAHAHHMLI